MQKNEMMNFQGRKAFMNLGIKGCVIKACLALYGILTECHRRFRGLLGIRKQRERESELLRKSGTHQSDHTLSSPKGNTKC
jgi:hypothetical protein